MILYHFCAAKHVRSILREGLTKGGLSEFSYRTGYCLHLGWTWLTTDPDPRNQSWATKNVIKYDRTAYRLTIDIPEMECSRLYDRVGVTLLHPGCDMLFQGFPGSENWRVFHGRIPRAWITDWKEMNSNENL